MKKTLLMNAIFVGMASYATAASLIISNTSNGVLAGLQKSDGTQGALIWGVVVDTGGDGFQGMSEETPYDANFLYRPTQTGAGGYTGPAIATGQLLSTVNNLNAVTTTNDVLFLAIGGMLGTAYTNDGGTGVANSSFRPSQIAGITLGSNGTAVSQAFAIIWFNTVNVPSGAGATLNTAAVDGTYYGIVTNAMATTPSGTDLNLPATAGGSTDVNSSFVGVEPARIAGFQLGTAVPEPSAALLGALGVLGLLRRRRN